MAEAVTKVPYDEFASNLGEFFDRVVRGNQTIILEMADGEGVLIESVRTENRSGRKSTKEDYEAFLASAGGWSDFDLDTFLKNLYESRNMPPHPPIEL